DDGFVEGEQNFEAAATESGHRAVYRRPVALLEGMEEARVRRHQDQPIAVLVANLQGTEPGGEFLGVELLLQLPLEKRPQRSGHETSNDAQRYSISTRFPQTVEIPYARGIGPKQLR